MDWQLEFEATYTSKSQATARRRKKTRRKPGDIEAAWERVAARHDPNADRGWLFWHFVEPMRESDPDAAMIYRHERLGEYGHEWKEAARQRKVAVKRRIRDGQKGRTVGEYRALASDQHPVLKAFVAKVPKGKRMSVGGDKAVVGPAPHRSKLLGCDAPYLETNKTMRGLIRVELDSDVTRAEIETACRDAKVPMANIIVGHRQGEAWHRPHLLWILGNSVAFTGAGQVKFRALYQRCLYGLTAILEPLGADCGGTMNACRMKNPLSEAWSSEVAAEVPCSLNDLRHVAIRPWHTAGMIKPPIADHPDDVIAITSNAFFRALAGWAWQHVRAAVETVGEEEWNGMVFDEADRMAGAMLRRPRSDKARQRISNVALLVADWNWRAAHRPKQPPKPRQRKTPAEIKERQATAGRRTGEARSAATRALIDAAITELTDAGQKVTSTAILEKQRDRICSTRTIQRAIAEAERATNAPPRG